MDVVSVPRVHVARPLALRFGSADERLVAQVRAGSRSAFEAIYDRHSAGLLSFCRHMLGSPEEAEDAVQHTFVAAYQSLLADDREIVLKAWLYTIARNRCVSILRTRREHVCLDETQAAPASTVGLAAEVEQRDDLRALLGDLHQLPEDQRVALILAELGSHSHEDIAVILGVPSTKIKALVFQARETLSNRRAARDADCTAIREEISDRRGGARRRLLRHHLAQCDGCKAFEVEVRRQRAAMRVLLPVAPTIALKHGSLTAAFAAAPGAAAGGAAVAGGASALAGGSSLLGAQLTGAKVLLTLAVVGAGGGGYVAVKEIASASSPPAREKPAPAQATAAHGSPSGVLPISSEGAGVTNVGAPTGDNSAAVAHEDALPCTDPCTSGAADETPVNGTAHAPAEDATMPVGTEASGPPAKEPKPVRAEQPGGPATQPSGGGNVPKADRPAKPAKPAATEPAATPHAPATPATPATPAYDGNPATPATPATSAKPDAPPGKPADPGRPDSPGKSPVDPPGPPPKP